MYFNILIVISSIFIQQITCPLSPEERQEFLNIHNHLRRSVFPPASNMQEMEYDEKLEKVVYEYLEKCRFEHRNLDNYGENGRLATDGNITSSVMSWFQERVYFNILDQSVKRCSKENSKLEYLNEVQCGHYQMMVKGTLKRLGCGYKFCKTSTSGTATYNDSYISFCFYESGLKDQPYEIGRTCSDCDTQYQFCNNDLCVPSGRYSKSIQTCLLKCQNCGEYFNPGNACLCDCPDGTIGNSCKGNPTIPNAKCSPCLKTGFSCNEGSENVTASRCTCACKDGFLGEYCDIRKDHLAASYPCLVNGIPWRYQMMVPVNALEFKNAFQNFQSIVVRDIISFCVNQKPIDEQCSEIISIPIKADGVSLIPGSLSILENGSLSFQMFINYFVLVGGSKKEKLVQPKLLDYVWNSPSNDLQLYVEGIKRITPLRLPTATTTALSKESLKWTSEVSEDKSTTTKKANFLSSTESKVTYICLLIFTTFRLQ